MPIWEYECEKCGNVVEKIVQLNSADEEEFTVLDDKCECGSNTFKKIMSSSSFRLEGGGWASQGYQKKK